MPCLDHCLVRSVSPVVVVALFVLGGGNRASAEPPADADTLSEDDASHPATGQVYSDAQRTEIINLLRRDAAFAALQVLPAARGGTLGIPSSVPLDGFQAGLDTQLIGEKADLFAQLGGLHISEHVRADVFVDVLQQDLPRFQHTSSLVRQWPATALSTAGLRGRYLPGGILRVSKPQTERCLAAVKSLLATDEKAKLNGYADEVLDHCDKSELVGRSWWEFSAGVRALRRSPLEDGGTASTGGAMELMASHNSDTTDHSQAWLFGVSAMRLTEASDMQAGQTVEYPKFSSLRFSLGYEFRGSYAASDHEVLPRIGAYAVATHAWWHDPYGGGTANPRIQSTEWEIGVYAAGRFQKRVQATVALRLLQPLGQQGTAFILSFIPSANASVESTNQAGSIESQKGNG
jgi:hypothetical protein